MAMSWWGWLSLAMLGLMVSATTIVAWSATWVWLPPAQQEMMRLTRERVRGQALPNYPMLLLIWMLWWSAWQR